MDPRLWSRPIKWLAGASPMALPALISRLISAKKAFQIKMRSRKRISACQQMQRSLESLQSRLFAFLSNNPVPFLTFIAWSPPEKTITPHFTYSPRSVSTNFLVKMLLVMAVEHCFERTATTARLREYCYRYRHDRYDRLDGGRITYLTNSNSTLSGFNCIASCS